MSGTNKGCYNYLKDLLLAVIFRLFKPVLFLALIHAAVVVVEELLATVRLWVWLCQHFAVINRGVTVA